MLSRIVTAVLPCVALGSDLLFDVSTGRSTSFIVDEGVAVASGRNQWGQLGLRNTDDATQFMSISVPGGALVKQVAAGAFHTIIVAVAEGTDDAGDVYVTGRNHKGQTGRGNSEASTGGVLEKLEIGKVKQAAAGYAHSVFLLEDGSVMATGWNHYGQLGHGEGVDQRTPDFVAPFVQMEVRAENATTAVPTPAPPPRAKAVAAGYDFTYILGENGDVWAVGNNLGGQLGFEDGQNRKTAAVVLPDVKQIAAGESHGIFLMEGGKQVFATGANFAGQLGDGSTLKAFTPVEVKDLSTPIDVAAAGDGSCIAELHLRCCGSNVFGQLGLRDDKFITEPANVQEVAIADSMAPGETHSLFLNHDEVMITGRNFFGELGNNDTTQRIDAPEKLITLVRPDLTTTVPPTPAPTPPTPPPTGPVVPTGAPAPSPDGDREPQTGGPLDGWPWQALVGGIASGLGVVLIVMCIMDRTGSQQQAESPGQRTTTESAQIRHALEQEPDF